jgi:hypothetical protein
MNVGVQDLIRPPEIRQYFAPFPTPVDRFTYLKSAYRLLTKRFKYLNLFIIEVIAPVV